MKDSFNDLLQTEVSRKEFLSTIGYGLAAMVGLAGLLKMLGHKGVDLGKGSGSAYGGSSYGK